MDRRLKKLLLYATGILFIISLSIILPLIVKAHRSASWPTTQALITKSSISTDAPGGSDAKYFLDLEYQYKVDGHLYKSDNYGTQKRLSSRSEGEMIDRMKQYPADTEIIIVYDPNDLNYARIQKGLAWYHLAGLVWIVISGGFFIASILAKVKTSDLQDAELASSSS